MGLSYVFSSCHSIPARPIVALLKLTVTKTSHTMLKKIILFALSGVIGTTLLYLMQPDKCSDRVSELRNYCEKTAWSQDIKICTPPTKRDLECAEHSILPEKRWSPCDQFREKIWKLMAEHSTLYPYDTKADCPD